LHTVRLVRIVLERKRVVRPMIEGLAVREFDNIQMHKNFIVENFAYRLGQYHPGKDIQIGTGNCDASIVVVQPQQKMPDRDAVTGALKNFDMLGSAYRATSNIVSSLPDVNREYLLELIQIIKPLLVVTCGIESTSALRGRKIRSFDAHTGKKFTIPDLDCDLFATLNPSDYGYARASQVLKAQGKKEWTKLSRLYKKLIDEREKARWAS